MFVFKERTLTSVGNHRMHVAWVLYHYISWYAIAKCARRPAPQANYFQDLLYLLTAPFCELTIVLEKSSLFMLLCKGCAVSWDSGADPQRILFGCQCWLCHMRVITAQLSVSPRGMTPTSPLARMLTWRAESESCGLCVVSRS